MPIAIQTLRQAANLPQSPRVRSLREAKASGTESAFICHSHKDAVLVKGLARLLEKAQWDAYIDWEDQEMPETPNSETAEKIKSAIRDHHYFLFLATPNSVQSRWCPWEIGYADALKPIENLLIIQTKDSAGKNYGNEYLNLYRSVDFTDSGHLMFWEPGMTTGGVPVRNLR